MYNYTYNSMYTHDSNSMYNNHIIVCIIMHIIVCIIMHIIVCIWRVGGDIQIFINISISTPYISPNFRRLIRLNEPKYIRYPYSQSIHIAKVSIYFTKF